MSILKKEYLLFISLIILVLAYRVWILINFSFEISDGDQTIMWLGTINYAQALFHEPCFYGQPYIIMLESILAIPLYKAGIPVYKALPIATSMLALFPYIFIAILTFIKHSKQTGVLILTILMLLPIEFDFITSLPRGFVSGIAFASISLFVLFRPQKNFSLFLFALFVSIAYTINSGSAILSLPCFLYLFLQNFKNRSYYIYTIAGLTGGALVYFLIAAFYIKHPNYALHTYYIDISSDYFIKGIKQLDLFFNNVSPLFWKQGFLVLFIPLILSFFLFKYKKFNKALMALSVPLLLLLTLFISKVHDGTNTIFFSYSRMYLAVPLLIVVLISFFKIRIRFFNIFLLAIFLSVLTYKVCITEKKVKNSLKEKSIVGTYETKKVLSECNELYQVCLDHNIDLMVISNHWMHDFYTYGCPACIHEFPETIKPSYERRTWRLLEDEKRIYPNVLILDLGRDLSNEYDFVFAIENKYGFYFIEKNELPTMQLLNKLNIDIRAY